MAKKTGPKQEFDVEVIKTPEGQVPTIDSFHKVIDGLFGEVLDTRKDLAKLIPNLENELNNLREILAQQMVLFETLRNDLFNLEDQIKGQGKELAKIQKTVASIQDSSLAEAELTKESQKAIARLIKSEVNSGTKPILDTLGELEKEVDKSKKTTLDEVEKGLNQLKDQIDDLSSKTELQMLEILESVNQKPVKKSSRSTSSKTKKKS